ncbi:MAG: tetratricopeptide repeat protein [Planctomycetota bacterium]
MFTRPGTERSQNIRPARQKNQPVRKESAERRRYAVADHLESRQRRRPSTRVYHDRPNEVRHVDRNEHVYVDRHHRLRHRTIWPRYRFLVNYGGWGHGFTFRYVYPYYHRKYVFVSLGGYWPVWYRHRRYYWYGCHSYNWYGYYPLAREVPADTYNYYTYNYYNNGSTAAIEPYQSVNGIRPVDHTTFADVREKLAQQAAEGPAPENLADSYFEGAVKAFETGDYGSAADMFARAIDLAPDDMVLPFAYCQAFFANEKYTEAAEVLRVALAKVLPEEEGVFYPRGLYPDDDVLFQQIEHLAEKAYLYSFDADLQLLLGYHLLGIGRIEEAVKPLQKASQDLQNSASAAVLLGLLEKIRTQKAEDNGQ